MTKPRTSKYAEILSGFGFKIYGPAPEIFNDPGAVRITALSSSQLTQEAHEDLSEYLEARKDALLNVPWFFRIHMTDTTLGHELDLTFVCDEHRNWWFAECSLDLSGHGLPDVTEWMFPTRRDPRELQ